MSYSGRLFLLKVGTGTGAVGSETWSTVAGITENAFTINDQTVDVTTKDSSGIRQLLDGVILQSMGMSGSGIIKDDATFKTLQTLMTSGAARNFQITVPGDNTAGGTYAGPFKVTSLEMTGAHDGATQFSISLESQTAITYTAIP